MQNPSAPHVLSPRQSSSFFQQRFAPPKFCSSLIRHFISGVSLSSSQLDFSWQKPSSEHVLSPLHSSEWLHWWGPSLFFFSSISHLFAYSSSSSSSSPGQLEKPAHWFVYWSQNLSPLHWLSLAQRPGPMSFKSSSIMHMSGSGSSSSSSSSSSGSNGGLGGSYLG